MNWNGNWNNGNGPGSNYPPQQQGWGQPQQPQMPQQGWGQPQGYPQQGGYGGYQDDVYGRLNNTKRVQQRDPFIDPGQHVLVVISIEKWVDQQKGPSVRVTFEYESSSNPQLVGQRCCKIYRLTKPAKFESQATDMDQFADFFCKLKGAPDGTPMGQEIRNVCEPQANGGQSEINPCRGARVNASASMNKKGNYVNVYWAPFAQTPQDIAQRRAMLDARGGAPVQAPPQQQGAPQMPGHGGSGMGAYVGQQQMQPFVPQGAPPQMPQQGAPMPPPNPQQYQQQPTQGPPQGAPQQGGFLAQIPGWNGGQQR